MPATELLPPTSPESLLPTPLATLAARRNRVVPSDHRTRFEDALLLAEASIKLTTVALVSVLAATDGQSAHKAEYDLIRADGIGDWVKALDRLTHKLFRQHSSLAKDLARNLTQRLPLAEGAAGSLPDLGRALFRVIEELDADDFTPPRSRVSLAQLYQSFTFLRNRTRGHGAKTPAFYESTHANLQTFADGAYGIEAYALKLCAFLAEDSPETCKLLELLGVNPDTQLSGNLPEIASRNSLYFLALDGTLYKCSRLLSCDSSNFSFHLANGGWKEASLKGEFLNYASGEATTAHLPQFGGPRPSLPGSHTAAGGLQYGNRSFHNLPTHATDYVNRPRLEDHVSTLVLDKVHRIITLKGPGGIGKTSLCLKVLHDLVDEAGSPFDFILWLSGRDVDLLLEGPAPREREIKDLDSIASFFVETFPAVTSGESSIERFIAGISNPQAHGAFLLVVDNFETLDDPEGIHRYLDDHLLLPSKLLITSRHKTYKGDFPVDVVGMERPEAEELIRREARAHLCEPSIDDRTVHAIVDATGGSPYGMKLAVAQIAHSKGTLQQTIRSSLGREDILDALFDRSYSLLSEGARYIYHLIAAIGKPIPEVILHGLAAQRGIDFIGASGELLGLSLVQHSGSDEGEALLFMPYVTRLHAERGILGFPDEPLIQADAEEVKGFLQAATSEGVVARFFREAVRRMARDSGSGPLPERLLDLCERCAGEEADRWLVLAVELRPHLPSERIRGFFKRAVEIDSLNNAAWRQWSEFEATLGDELQQVYKGIRAIEVGETDIFFCSHIAGRLLDVLRQPRMKDQFPPHRRVALLRAVRQEMEKHRESGILNSEGLGKLGWLYLTEYSPSSDPERGLVLRAQDCAEEGLRLEAGSDHCLNLYKKCRATLAAFR